MSAITDFMKRADEDHALRTELIAAQAVAVAEVAAKHGGGFSALEYLEAMSELSETELDAAAGETGLDEPNALRRQRQALKGAGALLQHGLLRGLPRNIR